MAIAPSRWALARQQAIMQSCVRGAMDDGRCSSNSALYARNHGVHGLTIMQESLTWIMESSDREADLVFAFRGNR